MPLAYTPAQKAAIAEFVAIAAVKDAAAAKALKACQWNVEQAIDSHFQKQGAARPASGNLGKIFDDFKDTPDTPDKIGPDGTMKYLAAIGVELDEPAMLSVLAQVEAPTMGELTRAGFIKGWDGVNASTLADQSRAAAGMRQRLGTDADLFRATYMHAFYLARQPGQKAVSLDAAVEFWKMLFGDHGWRWHSDPPPHTIAWRSLWIEFVVAQWNRSISRDLWNQVFAFALQTRADPSLAWYSEDASWPAVLDDFVAWLVKRGHVVPAEPMQTD